MRAQKIRILPSRRSQEVSGGSKHSFGSWIRSHVCYILEDNISILGSGPETLRDINLVEEIS